MASSILAAQAAEKARIENLKKGKSHEQQSVIDFFCTVGETKGCMSKSKVMSMDEYIALVKNKVENLNTKAMALNKIGLDISEIQEIAPIALASFVYDDDVMTKVAGGVAVTSQYALTWIFFSKTQIYTYKYIFDTTSDTTWEFTNDFFYTDITCLSTCRNLREKIDAVPSKGCFKSGESYVKNNYVVDTFEIVVPGTSYKFSMRDAESYEASIQAAKAMLREKKFDK